MSEKIEFDPNKDPNAISIILQTDGNWKGYTQRFGKLVEVREISPTDCLLRLMTHDGK